MHYRFSNPLHCECGDSCVPGCIGCRHSDACFCPFCAPACWDVEDDVAKLERQWNRGIITRQDAENRIIELAVSRHLVSPK